MEKKITFYWQELNKKYSSNQVFFILCYWILSTYQQIVEKKESPDNFDDWRLHLHELVKGSMDYDVKEAAVSLGRRIEWELLKNDDATLVLLEELSRDVHSYLVDRLCIESVHSTLRKCISEKVQQVMEMVFQIAEVNDLYSTTPMSVRQVVKTIFAKKDFANMADLCCGSGGFGLEVWKQLKESEKVSYCGIDIEPVMCEINTLMTYISGINKSIVKCEDILENIIKSERCKYDLVVMDVPRGQNKTIPVNEFNNLLPEIKQKNVYADWLYLMQAINSLSAHGRGSIVVTSGTLTRKNEAELRKKVVGNDWIEAVITLPVNLYVNTRVGSELIVVNKCKERKREKKILFIDASKFYFRDNRNSYSITQDGLKLIEEIFHGYYEKEGVSCIVETSKVDDEICSLKPLRYIGMQNKKDSHHNMVCLKDVARITRGVQLKKEEEDMLCQNGNAYYLNIKDISEGNICYKDSKKIVPKNNEWHKKFQIIEDDILITSKGTTLKIAMVEENPPESYICGNLTLLRVDSEKYHPYILYEFLKSEDGLKALESIQSGTTIRVLSNSNLEGLHVPMYDRNVMQQVGEQLKDKRKKYETEMKRLIDNYKTERKVLLELVRIKADKEDTYGKDIYKS